MAASNSCLRTWSRAPVWLAASSRRPLGARVYIHITSVTPSTWEGEEGRGRGQIKARPYLLWPIFHRVCHKLLQISAGASASPSAGLRAAREFSISDIRMNCTAVACCIKTRRQRSGQAGRRVSTPRPRPSR